MAQKAKKDSGVFGADIALKKSLKAMTWSFVAVVLILAIVLYLAHQNTEPKKTLRGTLVHPEGKARYLRESKPDSTGFFYKLAAPKYLVPNGTTFQVDQSVALMNGEVWHLVSITRGASVQFLDSSLMAVTETPVAGWIGGVTREGTIVVLNEEIQPGEEYPLRFLEQVVYLLAGSFFGLLAWKFISHQSFNEKTWNTKILAIESLLFFYFLTCVAYIGSAFGQLETSVLFKELSGGGGKIAVDSSVKSMFAVFTGGWIGASTVGFLLTISVCRFLSISERELK